MTYALVPDGYTLKKVSKLQKEAVDKFYSSKNIDSFLDGQASGELVKAVAIVVTPIVLAALAKGKLGELLGAAEEGTDSLISNILKTAGVSDLSALGTFNI